MRKKILWLLVSGLMALSLVIAACGPAAAPTTPTTPTKPTTPATPTKPAEEKTQKEKEAVAPAAEVPKYGGTITYRISSVSEKFDSGTKQTSGSALHHHVYEKFLDYDWRMGPAGSGEVNFAAGNSKLESILRPMLVQSWEMPDQNTWIFQVRRGVRWAQPNTEAGRLMGGREMTADDLVFSFRYLTNPDAAVMRSQSAVAKVANIEKTGPWEVTVRFPVDPFIGFWWLLFGGTHMVIYPPEVIKKYGNVEDWRNAVGTGPFMIVDYVPGSQFTLVRNPNYWQTDPVGPGKGNQLPYADGIRQLVIPDMSTALAALRTAKLDAMPGVPGDDARTVIRLSPELEYLKFLPASLGQVTFRLDDPKVPFYDVRVRQALMMATDFEALRRDYYGGEAEIDVFPLNKGFTGAGYIPLDQMPESVRALYRYNPEKARQLLKEAGYPSGFAATVNLESRRLDVDEASILKDMWAKVGVELTLDVREAGAYQALTRSENWPHMLYRSFDSLSLGAVVGLTQFRGTGPGAPSRTDDPKKRTDPVIEAAYRVVQDNLFINMPRVYEEYEKIKPYVLEQVFRIPMPTPYTYNFWWPWVKNYYGQHRDFSVYGGFLMYVWVDQDLKKKMGK